MTKDYGVYGVGHSPVCQILLQIVMRVVITSSPPALTSSVWMLLTPADFPFFNDCIGASTSLWRIGWSSSLSCWGTVQYWWISTGLVIVQLRAVFCPSDQYFSFFCEAFSRMTLDSSSFPLFHSGQVFHVLVCPLTVVLPQIFFNLTTLFVFSYPVFFFPFSCTSWCYCSLLYISQILQPFRLKSFLSQFSPFVTHIKIFCSDLGVLLLTVFAKNLTGCFSHCCVEGGDHWVHVCTLIVLDGERCKTSHLS